MNSISKGMVKAPIMILISIVGWQIIIIKVFIIIVKVVSPVAMINSKINCKVSIKSTPFHFYYIGIFERKIERRIYEFLIELNKETGRCDSSEPV